MTSFGNTYGGPIGFPQTKAQLQLSPGRERKSHFTRGRRYAKHAAGKERREVGREGRMERRKGGRKEKKKREGRKKGREEGRIIKRRGRHSVGQLTL